ncbi:hypothetical protein [Gordonia malaquae]|uniref:hypothetical protein n=1 Tax=Gordonia malaquae TaxID=410332 RepID=UPI00167CB5B9|nr:hypothetical protein [Gordonia malaquae]
MPRIPEAVCALRPVRAAQAYVISVDELTSKYRGASLRSPRIRNICNVRDAVCSMPAPWTRNVAQSADHIVGYFGTQHRY